MIDCKTWRFLHPALVEAASPLPRILREPPEEYDPDNDRRRRVIDGYDVDPSPTYRKYRSIDGKEQPDRLAKLLCPPKVWGYSLPTKKWGMYSIQGVLAEN
jgi:hypothetical protein